MMPNNAGLRSKKTPPSTISSSCNDQQGPNLEANKEPAQCVSVLRSVAMDLPLTLSLTISCLDRSVLMNFFLNSTSCSTTARFLAMSLRRSVRERLSARATSNTANTLFSKCLWSGGVGGILWRRSASKLPMLGFSSVEKTSHSVTVTFFDSASVVRVSPPPSACLLYVKPNPAMSTPQLGPSESGMERSPPPPNFGPHPL
mmetsp:Transcript_22822/g.53371  ORF Transcript_22822/g.53371 Transcript_22822/m.53371 type:complete len:201 (-) Transcript_22822:629-1231(-)